MTKYIFLSPLFDFFGYYQDLCGNFMMFWTCGSGLTGRKSRNMYSRLLLQMLRKGVLEGPFTHKPEAGGLKTLPTYMSIYLDEPLLGRSQEHRSAVLPDWVSGELGQTDGSWSTSVYRGKQKEADETIQKLEKRVQSLLRESQVIRQTKEKQISELKKMSDQSAEFLKNEWEKKLHAAVAEMEQEKFELQKKHTDNIQELLEDTNQRLANMEAEYSSQTQATEQMLHELETRVKQLSVEVENGNLLRQKVTQEKAELEINIASVSAELQEAYHSLSCCQASEVIEDLEQTVIHLKQQIQEAENRREKQLRVSRSHFFTPFHTDSKASGDPICFFFVFFCCRDKEEQLVRLRDSQRRQAQQAESALESFKKQVELSSEKTYADMKQQMEKVEADLIHSKSLGEKQSKEFSYQLEELQRRYEQQIVELKLQHEQERTHLLQTHNAEKDSLVQDHQQEIDSLDKQARAAMVQQQTQTQEWRKRNAQTISDLEDQVHSLRKELLAAHSQTKQQLTELGVLREEERQRAAQDQQAALDQLRAEMDQVRQDLERTHKAERELAQEKTNSRFKHLEKEYNQKLAKSAQVIAELQTSLSSVKEDSRQAQQSLERQLQEAQSHWDEERRQLNRNADQTSKVPQERVESLQRQLHAVEKKLMRRELEYQEQITHVRQECESKIKGLIPAELQQELEDTITSLKSQVIKNSHWTHINTYMLVHHLNIYITKK
uniref:Centrosomal protein 112 n=1 Tax=Cyprinus carpio TaxID=7962 RepID=A0A8C2G1J7_CYPCA